MGDLSAAVDSIKQAAQLAESAFPPDDTRRIKILEKRDKLTKEKQRPRRTE